MKNRMDTITDLLKDRVGGIFVEVSKQFKGANPYRQEPISPAEMLYEYNQITPEVREQLRQSMGINFELYEAKMEKIKGRYQ